MSHARQAAGGQLRVLQLRDTYCEVEALGHQVHLPVIEVYVEFHGRMAFAELSQRRAQVGKAEGQRRGLVRTDLGSLVLARLVLDVAYGRILGWIQQPEQPVSEAAQDAMRAIRLILAAPPAPPAAPLPSLRRHTPRPVRSTSTTIGAKLPSVEPGSPTRSTVTSGSALGS